MSPERMEIAKLVVSILGFGGTICALYFGFRQYKRAEQWKRAEFVAKEIKEFESNPIVRNVFQMIDWKKRRINLFQTENIKYDEYVRVTREDQWRALLPLQLKGIYPSVYADKDAIGKRIYTAEEAIIRDSYDVFLDYLQRFENFIESNLVSPKELEPYLIYWLKAIAYGYFPGDDAWRCVLLGYINYYKFSRVVELFKAYGIDISLEGEIFKNTKEKIKDKELYGLLLYVVQPDLLTKDELERYSHKTT